MESEDSDYGSDALSTLDLELFQAENESTTHSQRTVLVALGTCNISTRRGELIKPTPRPAKKIQRQRRVQKGINQSSLFCHIIIVLTIPQYILLDLNDQNEFPTIPPPKIPSFFQAAAPSSFHNQNLPPKNSYHPSTPEQNYTSEARDNMEDSITSDDIEELQHSA